MDVHQATISAAVMDCQGKLTMECILQTKAATILDFVRGLRGRLSVTFEEGTSAAWLHDLLKPHVTDLVVCDPRKNALPKDGSKSDRIDARKLAELLRGNQFHPVYHGEHGLRTLKELGRSYLTLTQAVSRVMTRIKALYRSWATPCSGAPVYAPRYRAEWLAKIPQPGVSLFRLPSFKTRLASSPPNDETHGKGRQARAIPRANSGALTDSGLDFKTKIFSTVRGRSFFLTSLFIELIDR
jgi:transposase